jgi:hypothetical protein
VGCFQLASRSGEANGTFLTRVSATRGRKNKADLLESKEAAIIIKKSKFFLYHTTFSSMLGFTLFFEAKKLEHDDCFAYQLKDKVAVEDQRNDAANANFCFKKQERISLPY